MFTAKRSDRTGVGPAPWKSFHLLLLLVVPVGLAGCASPRSGEPVPFELGQTYAFEGTVAGTALSGVFQVNDDGYQIYCPSGFREGVWSGWFPRASSMLDLECGGYELRFWVVDGQIQPEGTATLTTETVREGIFGSTDRTKRTGRITISRR